MESSLHNYAVESCQTWTTDRKQEGDNVLNGFLKLNNMGETLSLFFSALIASVQTKLEWPRLFVLEPELQAKPLSIDQHLAAVDAKIEALNSVQI
ncbi:hypothetical protein BASA83_013246 [Batrachochytrium salamandrivorans]|nr:hypothetical protein BASA83_013246 [Batrachochytrium salamandrivorans]